MNVLVAALILFSGGSRPAGNATDSVKIKAEYRLHFSSDFMGILGQVAQFFGIAPKHLSYEETIIEPRRRNDDFRMELKDQAGKEWLRVISDTAKTSFIDPPDLPTKTLKKDRLRPDVIRFIAGVREFFLRSAADNFRGSFYLWKDTVDIYVTRDKFRPEIYWLSSYNRKGKLCIKGSVTVNRSDGIVTYTRTDLYLYEEKVGIVLDLQNLEIKR